MLLLNINRKAYMGSPLMRLPLTLAERQGPGMDLFYL